MNEGDKLISKQYHWGLEYVNIVTEYVLGNPFLPERYRALLNAEHGAAELARPRAVSTLQVCNIKPLCHTSWLYRLQ